MGAGAGGRSFHAGALPDVAEVPWEELHDIPTAIVTGSNGKTTTVRLLAACARRHGWHAGYNCTDGVFLDDEVLATGDYSGPAGARMVLRERRTQAAILETARGGILRRGIAVSQANTAVVTNVSADHFGEYGIDDLEGLADVKLAVAAVVSDSGMLVLNADDAQLRAARGRSGTAIRALPAARLVCRRQRSGHLAQRCAGRCLNLRRARRTAASDASTAQSTISGRFQPCPCPWAALRPTTSPTWPVRHWPR